MVCRLIRLLKLFRTVQIKALIERDQRHKLKFILNHSQCNITANVRPNNADIHSSV